MSEKPDTPAEIVYRALYRRHGIGIGNIDLDSVQIALDEMTKAAETPTPETYRFESGPAPGIGFGKSESWTPENFVPVGPETLLADAPIPLWVLDIYGPSHAAALAFREARAMVDRELLEAIYVMLRVRP